MINPYLPQSGSLRCRRIIFNPEAVTIVVVTMTPAAACPICGRPFRGGHSRYVRTLADLPWQGRIVRWRLETRKFFCDRPACPRRIFTERLPEVAAVYARKTTRLNQALIYIAFACGGKGGSRLVVRLGMPISPDTLMRPCAVSGTLLRSVTALHVSWASTTGLCAGANDMEPSFAILNATAPGMCSTVAKPKRSPRGCNGIRKSK